MLSEPSLILYRLILTAGQKRIDHLPAWSVHSRSDSQQRLPCVTSKKRDVCSGRLIPQCIQMHMCSKVCIYIYIHAAHIVLIIKYVIFKNTLLCRQVHYVYIYIACSTCTYIYICIIYIYASYIIYIYMCVCDMCAYLYIHIGHLWSKHPWYISGLSGKSR